MSDEQVAVESEHEVDDAFRAIMEGLRTTLPGTQALFGFLLILPMQGAFAELISVERGAYYLAFFMAAVSSVLLIAPSAHQRLRAPRSGVKRKSRKHLMLTVRLTIAGTIAFAVALSSAVFLVSSVVFTQLTAAIASAVVTLVMAWAWFFLPLVTFERTD